METPLGNSLTIELPVSFHCHDLYRILRSTATCASSKLGGFNDSKAAAAKEVSQDLPTMKSDLCT
jgi:hypothetical protein